MIFLEFQRVTHKVVLEPIDRRASALEPRSFLHNENKQLQSASASSKSRL